MMTLSSVQLCVIYFQRDETSNTSTPTKLLPIDQIISHITAAGASTEKQQNVQTPDSQVGPENTSTEASRRSSTSTQNTDTLTPTNLPSDPTETQETVVSVATADAAADLHQTPKDDVSNIFPSSTTYTQSQIHDAAGSQGNELPKESIVQDPADLQEMEASKEAQPDASSMEVAALTAPVPIRKISRFLVSPVVEQKVLSNEEEGSATVVESADKVNALAAQSNVLSQPNIADEGQVKHNDLEANVLETQAATVPEKPSTETVIQTPQYVMEQIDNIQALHSGQQTINLQSTVPGQSMPPAQQMQQNIGAAQSSQHNVIMQGAGITHQATQQMQSAPQNIITVPQKDTQVPPSGVNLQGQYQPQQMQCNVLLQQQQITVQHNLTQMHIQPELQHPGQMQAQRPLQQFHPQQIPQQHQQYVILSGPIQQLQPTAIVDERNRRISNISTASNMSTDSQMSETASLTDDKKQPVPIPGTSMHHVQHVQLVPQQEGSNVTPMPQTVLEPVQQLQQAPQNMMNAPANVSVPVSVPVHQVVNAEVAPKVMPKTKEVSSTLPDLAQNLANILSNPKSKSVTPHCLTSHDPNPSVNVGAATTLDYKPTLQSEQYFQPIQPEASQMQIQSQFQHNYQTNVQQGISQTFQVAQQSHHAQMPLQQAMPLNAAQQLDPQLQMSQQNFQGVSAHTLSQGKWIASTNQNIIQQTIPARHTQQLQPQHQLQQTVPMQQQIVQDTQNLEGFVVADQSQLHLKLPDQQALGKASETENQELNTLTGYVRLESGILFTEFGFKYLSVLFEH